MPGDIPEARESARMVPGRCGLSPDCSLSERGRWQQQRLRGRDPDLAISDCECAARSAECSALECRGRMSVIPPLRGGKRRNQDLHEHAARVAGPSRIYFVRYCFLRFVFYSPRLRLTFSQSKYFYCGCVFRRMRFAFTGHLRLVFPMRCNEIRETINRTWPPPITASALFPRT